MVDHTPIDQTVAVQEAKESVLASSLDFRSDTITTPTPSMLASILSVPVHGDDVYNEDPTTKSLETLMASLTGKPAALFVLSGTMANQLAIRTNLTQPPHSILSDSRAHIYIYEAGGASVLSQAQITPVTPSNGSYLTLEDIEKNVYVGDDIHFAPTRLISLENTLGGSIMPLSEVRRISAFARENDIKMHLDGARLWNVIAAGAGSLEEYCAEFDSVSMCFSKGLGAPMGSILVGEKAFIERARWFRKMIGGGTRQSGVVTAPAKVAVEEIFLGGELKRSHELAKRIEGRWKELGGKTTYPCDTNMVWLDFASNGVDADEFLQEAKKAGLTINSSRLVVHHQISDKAVKRLEAVLEVVVKTASSSNKIKKLTNGSSNIYASLPKTSDE